MKNYLVSTPDSQIYTRLSSRPLTYGIAHKSSAQDQNKWVVNSFSSGTRATVEKRMKSLQKFYGGEWLILEAMLDEDSH